MVVSDVARACSRRDKTPMNDVPAAPKVDDASESSQHSPSTWQRPPEWEAYIIVDVLKNFMATMTDTILQQVIEKVKKSTMESVSSMRPQPAFDYVPTAGYEPSHRCAPAESLRRSDEVREAAWPERNGQSHERNHGHSMGDDAQQVIPALQACQVA